MKAYIVLIILAAAVWWEYNHRLNKQKGQRPVGVTPSLGRGVRQATMLSSSGNSSPGSGVQSQQPAMGSSWGIGGAYGPGLTGPTYVAPRPITRRAS